MSMINGKFNVEDQTPNGKGMSELNSKGTFMIDAILGDARKYGTKEMGVYVIENDNGKLVIKEK